MKKFLRQRRFIKLGLATCIFSLLFINVSAVARDYPRRPITNTVVWGAGGGTDSINRMLMAEMSKSLGTRISVNNRAGGVSGSIGMSYVTSRKADGYQLVGISESNVTAAVNGGWDKRFDVWYPFIFGGSPDLISVGQNSPFNSLEDLILAAKKPGSRLKVSAGGSGSIHHLNLLALMKGTGTHFQFIPYAGSSPAQTAAVTGEVDVVITTVAEQANLVRGKKLKPLAVLIEQDFNVQGHGDIPSALKKIDTLKQYLPIQQAVGFAVHSDAPEQVKQRLASAFGEAMASEKVKTWAEENYYLLSGIYGEPAQKSYLRLESLFSWTLHELGAARFSPEKFAIPKP